VLSCTGAYVSGAAGSNECPAGSVRIEAEAACRAAATATGKTAGSPFGVTSPIPPRGCYYSTITNTAYFNAHAVGAGASGFRLLCAALVTTGAPLHAPTRRRACAARCSRAVGLIIQTA
jgi:hypothetical protein